MTGVLDAWRSIVGAENVLVDAHALADAETATFATSQRVAAIVRPGSLAEVEACVRAANVHRAPIHPVSRGFSWGLGSRVPVRSGAALLDLGRLDRIVDFDERLGTMTVQPGVTFRQAHAFLAERKSRLFAAVTGGPPDGSLIGNALDRGEGSGPCGDRAAHLCGLEVVLPTGETIHTGFRRFANAATARLSRAGVGPALDGLFVQSGLGIVTEATVWLHPRPKVLERFALDLDDTPALAAAMDAIQPLVLQGTIPAHSFGLWNAYLTLAKGARYPWRAMKERTPLSFRARGGKEPWTASGALYAESAAQRTAGRKLVEKALRTLPSRPTFWTVDGASNAGDLCLGDPTEVHLTSMYWRKRAAGAFASGFDPHRDRCGVLWLHVSLPFVSSDVSRAVGLFETITAAHSLEPLVGLTCPNGRLVHAYAALVYDRDVEGEDARAMECHDRLLAELFAAGYPPYRLAIAAMPWAGAGSASYDDLLRTLKAALDPNGILSPGRYEAAPIQQAR
jgi:4-cresol dehydrogenase (hydroxylating)